MDIMSDKEFKKKLCKVLKDPEIIAYLRNILDQEPPRQDEAGPYELSTDQNIPADLERKSSKGDSHRLLQQIENLKAKLQKTEADLRRREEDASAQKQQAEQEKKHLQESLEHSREVLRQEEELLEETKKRLAESSSDARESAEAAVRQQREAERLETELTRTRQQMAEMRARMERERVQAEQICAPFVKALQAYGQFRKLPEELRSDLSGGIQADDPLTCILCCAQGSNMKDLWAAAKARLSRLSQEEITILWETVCFSMEMVNRLYGKTLYEPMEEEEGKRFDEERHIRSSDSSSYTGSIQQVLLPGIYNPSQKKVICKAVVRV